MQDKEEQFILKVNQLMREGLGLVAAIRKQKLRDLSAKHSAAHYAKNPEAAKERQRRRRAAAGAAER